MPKKTLLNWIKLSHPSLKHNINSLSRLAGKRHIAVCVKSNGYGHGIESMVTMLSSDKRVDYLTVHTLDEAGECRRHGWKRNIMLLGPAPLDSLDAVFELHVEPVIFTGQTLEKLAMLSKRFDQPVKTHLKLETGTHRQGVTEQDLKTFAKIYKKYPRLKRTHPIFMDIKLTPRRLCGGVCRAHFINKPYPF